MFQLSQKVQDVIKKLPDSQKHINEIERNEDHVKNLNNAMNITTEYFRIISEISGDDEDGDEDGADLLELDGKEEQKNSNCPPVPVARHFNDKCCHALVYDKSMVGKTIMRQCKKKKTNASNLCILHETRYIPKYTIDSIGNCYTNDGKIQVDNTRDIHTIFNDIDITGSINGVVKKTSDRIIKNTRENIIINTSRLQQTLLDIGLSGGEITKVIDDLCE